MKKILLLILLTNISLNFAVFVKLPDEKILNERLSILGLDDFLQQTQIVNKLANTEKNALGVMIVVECALCDYADKIKELTMVSESVQANRNQIYKAILEENPEILEELRNHLTNIDKKKLTYTKDEKK